MIVQKHLIFFFLVVAHWVRHLLVKSENLYKILFISGLEGFRWQVGRWKAWKVFEEAKAHVPAYGDFLKNHNNPQVTMRGRDPDFSAIPVIDKESYIKKYSIEERCQGGVIPSQGVVIDESSGTSGPPTNWVRGPKERMDVKKILQTSLHFAIGTQPIFLMNAFALGPWATGMNVSMSLVDVTILKSTGPDIKKIENTLNFFGPNYRYVIMGYPPFLKALADSKEIDWKKYNVTAVFGGEGMSEKMREYLHKAFRECYGSYGASDLEINIAAENDFTIKLRKLLIDNEALRNKIIKPEYGSMPMIFQYNPLDYVIESNAEGELVVTLCRASNVSPKIKYNIHDRGHVMRFPELKRILKGTSIPVDGISHYAELPLLFHYGRADMAVAFFGCKITPSQMEEVIFSFPQLAATVGSFTLISYEDDSVNKQLVLALEMIAGAEALKDRESFRVSIFEKLKEINQDFREISHMVPNESEPQLEVYLAGQGPFAVNDIRLKKHYIQKR